MDKLTEILETLRMFARAELEALTRRGVAALGEADVTNEEILADDWRTYVRRLRDAAEYSAYVPNSIKWTRMANFLEQWGAAQEIVKESK